MEVKRRVTLGGIWRSVYPVLVYTGIQICVGVIYGIAVSISAFFADTGYTDAEQYVMDHIAESTMNVLLLATVTALPLFFWLYSRDMRKKKLAGWNTDWFPITEGQLLWTAVGCAALAFFCNGLVSLLPLAQWSDSYEEVSETLYSGNVWLRIACVGFLGPAVEELVMRGLLYQRLRIMMRPAAAMLWSSLAFGIFHGNVIQGVYAFLVGLFLAWLMEHSQRLLVPAVGHMAANLFVLLLEDLKLLETIYSSVSLFLLATAAAGIVFLCCVRILKNNGM